jgi:anti-sigma B factor antagonist
MIDSGCALAKDLCRKLMTTDAEIIFDGDMLRTPHGTARRGATVRRCNTSVALCRTPTEEHRSATLIGSVALPCYAHCIVPSMKVSSDFPADFGLQVTKHGSDARVVTVVGQIDAPAGLKLANFLIAQLAVARVVIVDLDGVQLLGSAGLSALFEANELASQQGRALPLIGHSGIVNWALEAAGLRECFTFADSVPDAVKNSPRRPGVIDVGVSRRLHQRRRRSRQRASTVTRRAAVSSGH